MTQDPSTHTSIFYLRSGLAVQIRPIVGEDAPRLQAFFKRLSPESVYFRVLSLRKELTRQEAEYLSNVDHDRRMAFVAVISTEDEEHIIGVSRYSGDKKRPEAAEIAVVVEDAYHSQGLGSRLLALLTVYAREHGIRVFEASVSPQNERILRFIQNSGYSFQRKFDQGTYEIKIDLRG